MISNHHDYSASLDADDETIFQLKAIAYLCQKYGNIYEPAYDRILEKEYNY